MQTNPTFHWTLFSVGWKFKSQMNQNFSVVYSHSKIHASIAQKSKMVDKTSLAVAAVVLNKSVLLKNPAVEELVNG